MQTKAHVKASSPSDYSNNPVMWLESPSERDRNMRYPGLEFRRGPNKKADPEISLRFYLRFRETDSEDVLFQFMDEHPDEFQCSGWVFSVLGGKRPSLNENDALESKYWRRIKPPKPPAPTLPQMLVLAIESEERARFADGHRKHFTQAIRWLARNGNSKATEAAFKSSVGRTCSCLSRIRLSNLYNSVEYIKRVDDTDIPSTAHVLQEYSARICGFPGRTLRDWRKRFNLA